MGNRAFPPVEIPAEFDDIIRRFEEAWSGGGRPEIEGFVPAGLTNNTQLLFELVHIDLDFRLRNGEPPGSSTTWSDSPSWSRPRRAPGADRRRVRPAPPLAGRGRSRGVPAALPPVSARSCGARLGSRATPVVAARPRTSVGAAREPAGPSRLRDPPGAGAGRHGRRLPGAADRPRPGRGPQDAPARRTPPRRRSWTASAARPRPSPAWTTRTSSRSTRSASTPGCRTSA